MGVYIFWCNPTRYLFAIFYLISESILREFYLLSNRCLYYLLLIILYNFFGIFDLKFI